MELYDRLLREMDKLAAQVARDALAQPAGRDSFEYGRVCGMYAGITLAREKVLDTQKDAEEDDRQL